MIKVYFYKEGAAVFINNEKTFISEQAAKVLSFRSGNYEEHQKLMGALEIFAHSRDEFTNPTDESVIAFAEKCTVEEYEKHINGFKFSAWFLLLDGKAIEGAVYRNGTQMPDNDEIDALYNIYLNQVGK
ncbi:MAG TPA: hypothetical protein DDW85_02405 [Porphyromonadaceae bacterium]|nr:hypothetical protein [Porphyromonadaceae bacterium]